MPISDARRRANEKHLAQLDDIKIRVPKGQRAELHSAAQAEGKSLNEYVLDAVEEHERRKKPPED